MSMEFFATPWYGLFFKHQTKKYEVSHLEGTLNFIPYGCLVDRLAGCIGTLKMTPRRECRMAEA